MGVEPDPAPDPSPSVTIRAGDAENTTVRVSIDDPVDMIVVEENGSAVQEEHDVISIADGLPANPPSPPITNSKTPQFSPTKPIVGRRSMSLPGEKDYKALYAELKRRMLLYTNTTNEKLAQHEQNYNKLAAKIEEISEEHQKELDSMKSNYEEILSKKDSVIAEKNSKVDSLEDKIRGMTTGQMKIMRSPEEEMFRSKSKKTKGNTTAEPLKCQFPSCLKENEDILMKCNACGTWVCETCHDVPIGRLKPIMNKCSTLFFLCKTCDARNQTTQSCDVAPISTNNGATTTQPEILSSLKEMFDSKISQLESRFENMVENKLAEKLNLNPVATADGDKESASTLPEGSYASKVLKLPAEVRKALQDAKNDEKVEENEKEKRSQNFVIHGAEEIGANVNEIKENDTQYILDILKKLEIQCEAESVSRLGAPGKSEKRPIKVVMKTKEDQQKVMNNLRKLKGTEGEFGKISVTEDYTQTERKQIEEWVKKAKEQSDNDEKYLYKVRGTPKNGLHLIRVVRK